MDIPFRRPDDVPENVLEGPWKIMSLDAANWAAQKYADADETVKALEARRDAWLAQVREWFDAEAAPALRTRAKMDELLGAWALERRDETGKMSQRVVGGSIRTAEYKPRPEVTDKQAALDWVFDEVGQLDPDAFDRLAPRKLDAKELLGLLTVLDVPIRVVMSCGCSVEIPAHAWPPAQESPASVGRAVRCPSCGDTALIGKWAETVPMAVDAEGRQVDGVTMAPGTVKAYVHVGAGQAVEEQIADVG